ncbi:FAD-dependent oxidoreductase [Methylobacterium nodulans]|uniref:Fumarate reductase/succinate dehydrogenase flavoprotein domain protein n=1 Tax=Methylobacterium nodulans (strain LMG 21967 / CNCM I-2342 / ORS 2060) TaxID=460265 RepID=B8IW56_METNO|nr:FAD-dependent oxidoreductase [Methylobacterium nodulans]ACL62646.1 fumarate reductase/succinate dehydrogenase flavoprotein domain protein [Methylobacterium nodulans ORS 2060]
MDSAWDVIVVGSGAGGLTAASIAAAEGCSVLLVEQAPVVGGTTAISGGMVWIPGNGKAAQSPDRLEAARIYLEHTAPPGDRQRLEAFLASGADAVRDLEARTALRLQPVPTYPDYYPDLPGATSSGRVLEPEPYDAGQLGDAFALLRDPLPEFTLFGGMMISRQDIPHLRRVGRSWRSAWHVAKLLLRYGAQRLRARRGTTLYLGNALVARLLQSARDLGVTIRTRTSAERLVTDRSGRVAGVELVDGEGRRTTAQARRGVVLATGGLSHGGAMRASYVPTAAGTLTATVDPGKAARGARLATEVGARLSEPTEQGAFWVPASTFTRRDGSRGVFPHTVTDRAKPGLIAVGSDGRRFVNEAVSYHEFVRAQLASAGRAVPAWLLCDRQFLWKYGLGKVKPFTRFPGADIASGYLKRGSTLADLAAAIGVPAAALADTVETFNRDARCGEDPAFGRGRDIYQRHLGDADHAPNPCVAPIEHAPFYAVAVWPADLGMSAGIVTDAQARVLGADGSPIPGLFACGNDMASIMQGAYPGPGITLGPALTFGWIAGRGAASALREQTEQPTAGEPAALSPTGTS